MLRLSRLEFIILTFSGLSCRGREELVDPDVSFGDVLQQYIANHHTVTTSEDDEHKHRRNVRIYKFLWTTTTQPGKLPHTYGEDFGYDGVTGPRFWGDKYQECRGKHQSPININVLRVKQVVLPDIVFVGFDDPIDDVHVTNNGHTVLIEVENEPHPRVSGGPLDGNYVFSQMHFHWGDNDTFGSEDKINHRSFPMELHMVFYKEVYKSVKEAVKHSDGLTVLAFFYELDRHNHPAYDDITSALANVTEPHTTVVISQPFSFLNILPLDLQRYFTYKGSLTTPPCSEVVIWLDFEQPVRLAHDQIEIFRELRSASGKIRHNFRPIQPIGDRTVFYNVDNNYFTYNEIDDPDGDEKSHPKRKRTGKNGTTHIKINIFCFICVLLALL